MVLEEGKGFLVQRNPAVLWSRKTYMKQGAQSLWMKMRNSKLNLKGDTIIIYGLFPNTARWLELA